MSRVFNVSGRCLPDDHYMLPPLPRLPTVRRLIDSKAYFVLHAPRQVGKTTTLHAIAQDLTGSGEYAAVLVSMDIGKSVGKPVRPGKAGRRGVKKCDDFMKLRLSSSGCETRLARESARPVVSLAPEVVTPRAMRR